MKKMVVVVVMVVVSAVLLAGCATGLSRTGEEGAGIGAGLGAVTGALLDHKNAWRGGILGAAAGAVLLGTVGELSYRGAREAAESGRTVQYATSNGGVFQAEPGAYDEQTHCRKVHERLWNNGQLVKDQVKEVCEGTETTNSY